DVLDLHSFPTRRSSDLPAGAASRATRASKPEGNTSDPQRRDQRGTAVIPDTSLPGIHSRREEIACPGARGSQLIAAARSSSGVRSEEHTSELQSRENLV